MKIIWTKLEIKIKWNQMIGIKSETKFNQQKYIKKQNRWKSKEWGLHCINKTNKRKLLYFA